MIRRLDDPEVEDLGWLQDLKSPLFYWDLEQVVSLAKTHEFWGIWEDRQCLAVVALIRLPGSWEIPLLATHPEHQNKGLMRQLLTQVVEAKRQEAEIWLEVHEANSPARRLYASLGFELVGRRPRYYSDGGAALLLTRKSGG